MFIYSLFRTHYAPAGRREYLALSRHLYLYPYLSLLVQDFDLARSHDGLVETALRIQHCAALSQIEVIFLAHKPDVVVTGHFIRLKTYTLTVIPVSSNSPVNDLPLA